MPTTTRFAVGIHVLTALALSPGRLVSSDTIAGSVSTNPAVVRRLLGLMTEAGFTRAHLGQGGGFELARAAEAISLFDVYRVLEDPELFAIHRTAPDQSCLVGRNILGELKRTTDRARAAMEAELARTTIADIARGIRHRAERTIDVAG